MFSPIFAVPKNKVTLDLAGNGDSVAQLVEQYTFNVWALGSSPSGITKPHRNVGFFYAPNSVSGSFETCNGEASQACLSELNKLHG